MQGARIRAQYSDAFKREVVAEAMAPGASVAAVARRYGLNGNLLFGWRRDPRFAPADRAETATFVPVAIAPPAEPEGEEPASDRWLVIDLGDGARRTCLEDISALALSRVLKVLSR